MKKIIYNISLMLAIALSISSCDDKSDSDYIPGELTPANSMQVYFDASNASDFITAPGESAPIEILVSRMNTVEAAEVPVICKSAAKELTIPSSVHFEAGQKTAVLAITAGQMEENTKYAFDLAIGDEYADHYAKLDGASSYSGFVMEASWNAYVDNAEMTWNVGGSKQSWTRQIERLGNTDRYRIKDFIGSGLDMIFTIGGDAVGMDGYKNIVPYTNFADYSDESVIGFYLYDSAKQEYPTWTVGDKTVTGVCFMSTYIGSGDYSYISFDKGYACFGTYWTDYSDGTSNSYNYVELVFDPIK